MKGSVKLHPITTDRTLANGTIDLLEKKLAKLCIYSIKESDWLVLTWGVSNVGHYLQNS